ncbi:hypothetical protein MHYP_G00186090 [Metynnis hypsauchen]
MREGRRGLHPLFSISLHRLTLTFPVRCFVPPLHPLSPMVTDDAGDGSGVSSKAPGHAANACGSSGVLSVAVDHGVSMFSPFDSQTELPDSEPAPRQRPQKSTSGLADQVQTLQAEVRHLQQCLTDSLNIQKSILEQWGQSGSMTGAAHHTRAGRVVSSTPSTMPGPVHVSTTRCAAPGPQSSGVSTFSPGFVDLNNTSRVLASVLHQSKLEPPVFAGDGKVQPDEWLQSMNIYRTSLDLTDAQVFLELPRFLANEPRKWFTVLRTHMVTWAQFCDLFKKVFLPSDIQEQVMRGILDRVQAPEEPLPTFVAHMLSEFNKLRSPPPERDQIDLICKHTLERYRVALYGTPITSVMDLLLRAHELHSALGPSGHHRRSIQKRNDPPNETYCFKCSLPGFTSRACPRCNSFSQGNNSSHNISADVAHGSLNSEAPVPVGDNSTHSGGRRSSGRQQGNFKGGRMFHRGTPPPRE